MRADSTNGAPESREANPQDVSLADQSRIQLDDLPTGFREELQETEGNVGDRFQRCFDDQVSGMTVTGRADRNGFANGEGGNVGSTAVVLADMTDAESLVEKLDAEGFQECFRSGVQDGLRQAAAEGEGQVQVEDARSGRVSFPDVAEETIAYQIEAQLRTESFDISAYVDLVGLRVDRVVSVLLFSNLGTPFDEGLKEELARAVHGRMAPS